jgi:hypothetical protein
MLVSLGAAAYTMAGTYGVQGFGTVQDAGRVAAQVVTGIGFIGAGTIWRSTGNDRVIRGLTTAASVWVAASIGMLCGFGLYLLAIGCALLTLVVLRLVRMVENGPLALSRAVAAFWRARRAPPATAPETMPATPRPAAAAAVQGTPLPESPSDGPPAVPAEPVAQPVVTAGGMIGAAAVPGDGDIADAEAAPVPERRPSERHPPPLRKRNRTHKKASKGKKRDRPLETVDQIID